MCECILYMRECVCVWGCSLLTACLVHMMCSHVSHLQSWPPFGVQKCMQFGSGKISLCLQMRVSWSEQSPWSSRETLKAAVSSVQRDATLFMWSAVHVHIYMSIRTMYGTWHGSYIFQTNSSISSLGGCGYPCGCARIFSTIWLWFCMISHGRNLGRNSAWMCAENSKTQQVYIPT